MSANFVVSDSREINALFINGNAIEAANIVRYAQSTGLNLKALVIGDKKTFDAEVDTLGWDVVVLENDPPGFTLDYLIDRIDTFSPGLPVILLSSLSNDSDLNEWLQSRVIQYSEGKEPSRLCPVIIAAVDQRRALAERRKSQQQLLEQRALFNSIIDSLKEATIILSDQGVIEYWSQAATDIFQYEAGAVIGQNIQSILLRETPPLRVDPHLQALSFEQLTKLSPSRVELILCCKLGKTIAAEVSIQSFSMDERLKHSLVIRDIYKVLHDRRRNKLSVEFASVQSDILSEASGCRSALDLYELILLKLTKLAVLNTSGSATLALKLPDEKFQVVNFRNGKTHIDTCGTSEICWIKEPCNGRTPVLLARQPDCFSGCLTAVDASCCVIPLSFERNTNLAVGHILLWVEKTEELEGYELRHLTSLGRTVERVIESFYENKKLFKLQRAVEESPVSIVITSDKGIIEYANQCALKTSGYEACEMVGQHTRIFQSGMTAEAVYKNLWSTINSGRTWRGEIQNKKKNGELYWEKSIIFPISSGNGSALSFVGIKEDITEKKRQSETLNFISTHDDVTGLANRSLLVDRMGQVIDRYRDSNKKFSVVLISIKNFKQFNQALGYSQSNALLLYIANMLQSELAAGESLARASGAELYLLLELSSSIEEVSTRYRQITQAFTQKFHFADTDIKINFCSGAAIYPDHGDNAELLLSLIEEARIESKVSGEQQLQFIDPALNPGSISRFNFRTEVERALQEKEFELYYQPQIDAKDGSIIGCEALIRWRHPDKGFISPAVFIPLAEESDLIESIGDWVLENAFAQLFLWKKKLPEKFSMAINLSAKQLVSQGLLVKVEELLKSYDIRPDMLEFEITESSVIGNLEDSIELLRQFQEMGCAVSIDDFGTGYSNLGNLKQIPLDRLKIDRCFVQEITHSAEDALLSKLIIQISHTLGLKVVAEGVETEAQYKMLKRLNCDYLQGFYFSKPVPPAEFYALVHGATWDISSSVSDDQNVLLIVDDEKGVLSSLGRLFRRSAFKVIMTESPREAMEILAIHPVGVVLCDQRLQEMSGTELLRRIKRMYPETMRIMLSSFTEIEPVTQAVNEGAIYKFFLKPWNDDELKAEIDSAFIYYNEKRLQGQGRRSSDVKRG